MSTRHPPFYLREDGMASQKAAIKAKLTASASWTAIFGSRTYIPDDLPDTGLTYSNAVKDTDGVSILPHAVLTFGASNQKEIVSISERRFFDLYLYEHRGTVNIDAAKRLAKTLLHRQQVVSDNEGLNFISWTGGSPDYKDDSLNGVSAVFVRFYIDYTNQ
jgi:hypothetical protein